MRTKCVAILVALIALPTGGRAGQLDSGTPAVRMVGRRHLPAQPPRAVYGPNGYTPAWVYDVPFNRRYNGNKPTLGPNGCYTGDYGQMHGWGFPGGRWDPSQPRD